MVIMEDTVLDVHPLDPRGEGQTIHTTVQVVQIWDRRPVVVVGVGVLAPVVV